MLRYISELEKLVTLHQQEKIYTEEEFKKAVIDAWNDGDYSYFYSKETGKDFENGEQYYQEKYGNNQLQLSNRGNILVDQKIESYVELKSKKD